jgi:uncharacterized membrane protein YhhN
MLKKHLQFSVAYVIIFIGQILMLTNSGIVNLVLEDFHYIIKPLIIISLIIFYVYHTQLSGRFAKRIFVGLLFGLMGDVFLMFVAKNQSFFMFGLVAFLIGHLWYVSAFYLDYKWSPATERKATWFALIVFGVFCIGFYLYLRPYLNEMKIPVMIYAFVVSLMAMMAVNRKGRVNGGSFNLIFIGAIFFLISDSVLAYNKFVIPFKGADIVIISTYMLAQYLITIGAVERKLKKHAVIERENKF